MISDSAALLMFAIRSSIKLGQQARQSFVDSTRRRELFLPLPNFFAGTNEFDAKQYSKSQRSANGSWTVSC